MRLKDMNHSNQPQRAALALGNFDGLHRGHLAVLDAAMAAAKENGLCPTVLLFDIHPKELLFGAPPPSLLTDEMKRELLTARGFQIKTVSFRDIRDLSPADFAQTLRDTLHAAVVCCGANYRFGQHAAGTADDLRRFGSQFGFQVRVAPQVELGGIPVSATRIRRAIEDGDIPAANAMLGRPFSYRLTVVSGDRRGRLLGFPTINQFFPDRFVRPRAGVYASAVTLGGRRHCAVTNIGVRPTIGTETFRSETCILDFSGDLYGQEIEVQLLQFLRPEHKFDTLDGLKATMRHDAETAKRLFEKDLNQP